MNLHYGLIPIGDVILLFLQYFIVALVVAWSAKLLLKDFNRSFVFAFLLLCLFFLFGALKDLLGSTPVTGRLSSYRILLPSLFLIVLLIFLLLKYRNTSWRLLARYLTTLLCILLLYETLLLSYNIITGDSDPDFGDEEHSLIADKSIGPRSAKPDIFWIVMDEYGEAGTLHRKWGFRNPLDSILKQKKFFVADSATSPYNFTHYSMDAMLDMTYLDGLHNGSVVRFEHMVLGDRSVYRNNVVDFLQRNGYAIKNYTMFDMKGMPAHRYIRFKSEPRRLISDNTLYARIQKDIGWNFFNLFAESKNAADAKDLEKSFRKLAAEQEALIRLYEEEIERGKNSLNPNFFMLQFMLTHEPFLYNADGSLHPRASFTSADAYISSIEYANKVILKLCDRIINTYQARDFVIIFQSDHGFKFDEADPLFKESCKIPFAVYSSNQNYEGWQHDVAGVNIFRILFNKYFHTGYTLLDTRTHLLRYRE